MKLYLSASAIGFVHLEGDNDILLLSALKNLSDVFCANWACCSSVLFSKLDVLWRKLSVFFGKLSMLLW